MKPDRFSELLQDIDKSLIVRAQKRRNNNKAIIIRMVAYAACLAIVVTGGIHAFVINGNLNTPDDEIDSIIGNEGVEFDPSGSNTGSIEGDAEGGTASDGAPSKPNVNAGGEQKPNGNINLGDGTDQSTDGNTNLGGGNYDGNYYPPDDEGNDDNYYVDWGNDEPDYIPEEIPVKTPNLNSSAVKKLGVAVYPENQQLHTKTDSTGNAEYVKKLMSTLMTDDGENNKVISPANIYFALAALCETTGGDTQKQILDLLGKSDIEKLRDNSHLLWKKMYVNEKTAKSTFASSLWLTDKYTNRYNKDTVNILKDKYFASTFSGDFADEKYTKAIGEWINQQTGGFLQEQVKDIKFEPETAMSLMSTISYRAQWYKKFKKEDTKKGLFHTNNGDYQVDYMCQEGAYDIIYTDKCMALNKELAGGARMTFILPDEGYTVSDILNDERTNYIISGNTYQKEGLSSRFTIVKLSVPKFDLSTNVDLKDSLKSLGVSDAFDVEKADFSNLCDSEDMFLNKAEHSVKLKVDEVGVEGAGYTYLGVQNSGIPQDNMEFILDRPFIVSVSGYDDMPRFVGIVNKP